MSQGELFPYARPETVLAFIRRLEGIWIPIAPEATRAHCLLQLGDLSISTAIAEKISLEIRTTRAWQERQQLPAIALPDPPDDSLEALRHWRAAHKPVKYERTQTPAWPDKGFARRPRS